MSTKVFTAADIEAHLKSGKTAADLPKGSVLTPSAKDVLRDGIGPVRAGGSSAAPSAYSEPILPDYEFKWTPGKDPKTPAEIHAFFHSPAIVELKQRMVDIGKRTAPASAARTRASTGSRTCGPSRCRPSATQGRSRPVSRVKW